MLNQTKDYLSNDIIFHPDIDDDIRRECLQITLKIRNSHAKNHRNLTTIFDDDKHVDFLYDHLMCEGCNYPEDFKLYTEKDN